MWNLVKQIANQVQYCICVSRKNVQYSLCCSVRLSIFCPVFSSQHINKHNFHFLEAVVENRTNNLQLKLFVKWANGQKIMLKHLNSITCAIPAVLIHKILILSSWTKLKFVKPDKRLNKLRLLAGQITSDIKYGLHSYELLLPSFHLTS